MRTNLTLLGILISLFLTKAQNVFPTIGNVGIGTNSPGHRLEIVTGSGSTTGEGISIRNTSSSNPPTIFLNNTSGNSGNWQLQSGPYASGSFGEFRLTCTNNSHTPFKVSSNGSCAILDPSSISTAYNGQFLVRTASQAQAIRGENNGGAQMATAIHGYAVGSGGPNSVAKGVQGLAYYTNENNGGSFESHWGVIGKGVYSKADEATSVNYGGHFEASCLSSNGGAYGVLATANSRNAYSFGVVGQASGGSGGYHYGGAFSSTDNNSVANFGATGLASGANNINIGLSGLATANLSSPAPYTFNWFYPQTYVGVYGSAALNTGYVTPSNQWAGWFDNDLMINGTGYNTGFGVFTSDKKFKKDIKSIENASAIISQLNPSTYYMLTENEFGLNFSNKKQFGFISQEVESVLPDLVTNVHKPASIDKYGNENTKSVDFKGLNYMGFIALLTKGLQEQQAKIDNLEEQLATQKVSGLNNINIETGFQMSQNEPNPFTHETVVKYTLPQSVSNAYMAVYDLTGKQITTFPIEQKGSSSITITSEKLSAGIYIYSIVADGKVMDSKRMIVADK